MSTLVAALIACSIAQSPPSDPARAKAEEHAKIAERHFRDARYEDALEEYTRAKAALPLPAFLFNIGQCHKELEEWEQAILAFETYLPHAASAEDRQAAEAMIAECKAGRGGQPKVINLFEPDREVRLLEAKGEPALLAAAPPPPASKELDTPAIDLPPPAPPPARIEPELSAETAPETEEDAIYERWWFWTAIGGAVAIAVGGTIIGLNAKGDEIVELPRGSVGTVDWR